MADTVKVGSASMSQWEYDRLMAWVNTLKTGGTLDNTKQAVAWMDEKGLGGMGDPNDKNSFAFFRSAAMDQLGKQTIDPMDTMIKQAALAQLQRIKGGSRQASFVTGARGLEGPMANSIFGGGTSLLGS